MKWWRVVLVLLGAAALSILLAHRADAAGGTDVCGPLPAGQTTWNALGSPYRICDYGVVVPSNATLVLDGAVGSVQVQAQGSGGIRVQGAIATHATGPTAEILFDGPGSQTSGWEGVTSDRHETGQASTITFDLSYVDVAHSAGIGGVAASVRLDHVAVHDGPFGIYPEATTTSVTNSSVSDVGSQVASQGLGSDGISNICPTYLLPTVSPSTVIESNTVVRAGRRGIVVSACGLSGSLVLRHNRVTDSGHGPEWMNAPNLAVIANSLSSTLGPGGDIDDNQGSGNLRDVLQLSGTLNGGFTWVTPTNASTLHPLGYTLRFASIQGPGTVTIPANSVVKGALLFDGTVDASAPGSVFTSPVDNSVGIALCPETTPSSCQPSADDYEAGVAAVSGTFVDATVRFGVRGFTASKSLSVTGSTISDVGTGLSVGSGGTISAFDLHVDGTHITRTTGTAIAGPNLTHGTIANVQISDAGQGGTGEGVDVWAGDGGQVSVTAVSVDAAARRGIAVGAVPGGTLVAQGNRVTNSGHTPLQNEAFHPAPAMAVSGEFTLGPGGGVANNTGSGNGLDAIELSGTPLTSFTWVSPTNSASDHALGYMGDSLTLPSGVVMTAPKNAVLKFHSIAAGDIAPSLAVNGGTIDASAGGSIWTAWDDPSAGPVTCFDAPAFPCPTTFSWRGITISADSGTGVKGNAHFVGASIRHGDLEYTSGAASTPGDATHGLALDGSTFDGGRITIRSTGARIDGSRITGHPGDFVDYAVALNDGVGATMTCDTITKNAGGIVIFSNPPTSSTALTITDSNIFDNREPPPPAPYLPQDVNANELSGASIPVSARSNYWGQPGGPVAGQVANAAYVDTASPLDAPPACAPPPLEGAFFPLTPARILDTRTTNTPLTQGETRAVQVAGQGGVPSNATAVVVNVTETGATADGFFTVYPSDAPSRPTASNLNFYAGETIPNLVVVKLGADGKVDLFNLAGSAHAIFDVVGYYAAGSTGYRAVTPARILDTRPTNTPLTQGETRAVHVAGQGGVPTNATAVVVNVTETEATANGFLTVYPSDAPSRPNASSLNFYAGETIPNLVVVKLGADGKVNLFNLAGTAHAIFDVVGYYGSGGSDYSALTPARILDTRTTNTPLNQGETRVVQVAGQGGVPANASAVVVNVTETGATANGFFTVYPSDAASRPNASNLNFYAGETIPNLVVVKLGSDGKVDLYNLAGSAHAIFDVVGYFGP